MKNNKKVYFILGFSLVNYLTYIINNNYFIKNRRITIDKKKLNVSTSFYPLYFFARKIAGNKANIKNITPSGVEPHDFDLSAQDIANIGKGDLLILNGGLETWENKIKQNFKDTNLKIITITDNLITKEVKEENELIKDPHIWLSPPLAKREVEKIINAFVEIDSMNSNYYKNNGKNLTDELDKLDNKYKIGLINCRRKDFITSHTAFAYLSEAYGLKQISVSGMSPDEEPSLKMIAKIAMFAKENNIKYIFFESMVSPKISETIANEIGAKTLILDPIEGISENNIKQGEDYFTIMENNLKNLRLALECKN